MFYLKRLKSGLSEDLYRHSDDLCMAEYVYLYTFATLTIV